MGCRRRSARISRLCSTSARRLTSGYHYTARSMERTHRWLRRCLEWHEAHGPPAQGVYSIGPGGTFHELQMVFVTAAAAAAPSFGSRSAARSGRTRPKCMRSWTGRQRARAAGARTAAAPAGDRGDRRSDQRRARSDRYVRPRDAALLGRHGVALVPDPDGRWRLDLQKRRHREADEPILDGRRARPAAAASRGPTCITLCLWPADRAAADHAAQPELHRLRDGGSAWRCRNRAPGGGGGRAQRRRGPGCGVQRTRRTRPVIDLVYLSSSCCIWVIACCTSEPTTFCSARWSRRPWRSRRPPRRSPPGRPARRPRPSAVVGRAGAAWADRRAGWRRGTAAAALRLAGTCLGADA